MDEQHGETEDEELTSTIGVRFTPSHAARITALAEKLGTTPARIVRTTMLTALETLEHYGDELKPLVHEALTESADQRRRRKVREKLDRGEDVSISDAAEVGLVPDMPHPGDVTLSSGEVISKAELHEGQDDADYYTGLTEAVGLATRARKAQEAVNALGAGKRHYHRVASEKRDGASRTWFDKGVEWGEFPCVDCGHPLARRVKE